MRPDTFVIRWVLAFASFTLLAGCASNPGLAKFGGAATALVDSYRPILATPARLCTENRTLGLMTEPDFNLQTLDKDDVIVKCGLLATQQKSRLVAADAIAAYGQQLSILAGADSAALTPDIEGLAKAAKGIKDEAGDPTFNSTKVDAVTKIVSIVVELARGAQAKRTAKEVMDEAQQPLESLVEEMKIWTEAAVIPRLDGSIDRHQFLFDAVVRESKPTGTLTVNQTLPFRLAQKSMADDIKALKAEKETAKAFPAAATALVDSHRTLRQTLNSSSKEAQLEAVRGFIEKVVDLRKAAQAL